MVTQSLGDAAMDRAGVLDGEEPGHPLDRTAQDELYVGHPRRPVEVDHPRLALVRVEDQHRRHAHLIADTSPEKKKGRREAGPS